MYKYENGALKKLPVVLNNRVGSEYILASGVEAGAAIVARDVAGLKDGQRVLTEVN